MKKLPPFALIAIAASMGVSISACGDSDDSRACATDSSNEVAEVCIVGSPFNLTIETSGLEPESELSLTSGKTGESSYAVAETGSLDGRVGFLGDFTGETITISGTWASGEQFNVDIKIQP